MLIVLLYLIICDEKYTKKFKDYTELNRSLVI